MPLSLAWGIDDYVVVNSHKYPIDLEFSKVLRWYEMWKDKELDAHTKIFSSLVMIVAIEWGESFPADLDEIAEVIPYEDIIPLSEAIIKRIAGDQTPSENVVRDLKGNILEDENRTWYDFEADSGYIYSSFLMDYGMDLLEERKKKTLHWDKFNALVGGLSDETHFKRVIRIRQMDYPKNADQDQIEEIRKAKQAVALKKDRAALEFEMMDLKQKREYMAKQGGGGADGE